MRLAMRDIESGTSSTIQSAIMTLSKPEAKQLLERLIFADERPQDWVQDVWSLSPTLGESAARLLDAFDALADCCSEEKLDTLLKNFYSEDPYQDG